MSGAVLTAGRVAALRRRRRAWTGSIVLLALLAAGVLATLGSGSLALDPIAVIQALVGIGDDGAQFVVRELRLPRLLLAIVVGSMFGMSGAIFQSLVRNPLG